MVFMVSGPMSASTYLTSEYSGIGAGAGPEKSLGSSPFSRGEPLKPCAAKYPFVDRVGHLSAGNGHCSPQIPGRSGLGATHCHNFSEGGVYQNIDPAQEKTRHRCDPIQGFSLGEPIFQTGHISIGHFFITRQTKEQGYIDIYTLADKLADSRQTLFGCRHFNKDIRPSHQLPKTPGF